VLPLTISGPRSDVEGLEELAPLWHELHRYHREVATYEGLVEDLDASWASRRDWYRRLLAQGARYVTATDSEGRVVGYAMVAVEHGADDTFAVTGGTAEVVTLVVTRERRSSGVGQALLEAAEGIARSHGFDTVRVAVMAGNARAPGFYERHGYSVAEHVMVRRLRD
jgi:ribosomal protein S18 acetylase RimI-like enzyme